MKKIAMITGASSGIGAQTALDLQQAGYQVVGGARHIEGATQLTAAGVDMQHLDVTDSESNQAFVDHAIKQYGRIDVLVNSAGYGSFGALAEVPISEAKRQLDVNLFGMVDLIQQVLPTMRKQHSGKIVNISSLAGRSYGALAGWYFISKHAMETMSDVLRLEVAQFGIDVIIVEPGITKSNWANVTNKQLAKVTPADSPYRAMAEKQASMITHASQTPAEVAAVIKKGIEADKPKIRYQVKLRDQLMMTMLPFSSYRQQDKAAMKLMQ